MASSSRPQTPQGRSSSRRPASPDLLDSLLITADADTDAATEPNLADLSLTELVAPTSRQQKGRPSLKGKGRSARPSWDPVNVGSSSGSGSGSQIRLLQGLSDLGDDDSSASGKGSGKHPPSSAAAAIAGRVAARPRFSLFTRKSLAPTQLQRAEAAAATDIDQPRGAAASLPRLSEAEPLVDESMRLVDDRLPEPEPAPAPIQPPAEDAASSSIAPSAEHPTDLAASDSAAHRASAARDREDALRRNLLEVRRMNEVFEGYEAMLKGSADQIDQFADRVRTTDTLLDRYIALLRDSSRTQELLLSPQWKGASADSAEAHDLAIALAQRETERVREEDERRRREAEIERRRREAEARERERMREDEARRAALVTSSGYGSVRGVRTGAAAAGARGGPAAAKRGASTAGARIGAAAGAKPPVAGHTRGASASTRGALSSSSSTTTTASRLGRSSSIPRPPSAGGR
ncbi:hypothetical protein CF328_g738 [Tilletia controversa]|nr:hypothetical protein CF328_g738 [Tilletia controversa]